MTTPVGPFCFCFCFFSLGTNIKRYYVDESRPFQVILLIKGGGGGGSLYYTKEILFGRGRNDDLETTDLTVVSSAEVVSGDTTRVEE